MSGLEFIAALVSALAWPATAVIVAVLFRRQLAVLLARPFSSMKAGPLELVWDREIAEAESEIEPRPDAAHSGPGELSITDSLREVARVAPAAAVVHAFAILEKQLRQLLDAAGVDARGTARQISRQALDAGLIQPETMSAIDGVAVLRNLAAHGFQAELDERRALDYLALVDAVSYALIDSTRDSLTEDLQEA
jgi:hypothetical protein